MEMNQDARSRMAEERIAEVQRSRQGGRQGRQEHVAEPETRVSQMRTSTSALVKSAIQKIQGEDTVYLPEMSRRVGQPVRFKVRQLTVQELTVSNLLPQRAARMVDNYIRRGVSETEAMRRKYKLESPIDDDPMSEVNRIAEEAFDGDTAEVAKAWFELESAIACSAVVEPGVILKYDAPINEDAGEFLVWNLPEEDIRAISNHALRDAFASSEKAENFREAENADGALAGFDGVEHETERAGDI